MLAYYGRASVVGAHSKGERRMLACGEYRSILYVR